MYFVTVTKHCLYSEHASCVSMIFFHLCLCGCSFSHNLVVCAVKMSNYFSSILFQIVKWFSFFFLFTAILVCCTWFLKKLRLCRRATTLAHCNFVLLFEVPAYHHCRWQWRCRQTNQALRTHKTFPFHLDYTDASLFGYNISPMIYGTVALEC